MAQELNGKVALVTGVSKGIGRAIAQRLAQDRAAVVVNYAGSAQQAQEAVGLIEQAGGRAAAVQADVSKVADVRRLLDACFEKYGRLDILVNNAGMMFTKPVAAATATTDRPVNPSSGWDKGKRPGVKPGHFC